MMVWVAGIVGFISGFAAGLALLRRWLSDMSRDELMKDKNLHRSYGLFVWMVAGITSAAAVWLYKYYF